MFGDQGSTLERDQQKELCEKKVLQEFAPRGAATCVIEMSPGFQTQIRFTWMQYFYDAGPGPPPRQLEGDACSAAGLMPMRRCLDRILEFSQPGDILLFYMGLSYAFAWPELFEIQPPFAVDEWLDTSTLMWKSAIPSSWKGRQDDIFRVRLAGHVKGRADTSPSNEANNAKVYEYVPRINDVMDRNFASTAWGVIDQWRINAGNESLYNDAWHFQGPLSQATWHTLLSKLCGNPNPYASEEAPGVIASKDAEA